MRPIFPRLFALAALIAALPALPARSDAQQTSSISGMVRDPSGKPIAGATIFLLETLEEVTSDGAGRFLLQTRFIGPVTIVARKLTFIPSTADLILPLDTVLQLTLRAHPPALRSITVVAAGEYTLGTGTTATLTPLEVAQTPGAAANVSRAIQTLPGVQNVDEGTGLFVRGGDVSETRVLIDDVTFLSPVRFDNPTGHVTATIDPFLLDRTVFSSGGFGAAYGNALSGLVRMETAARPTQTNGSLTASIGSLGGALALAPTRRIGLRLAGKRNSLAPLINTFGQAQPFDPAPQGGDLSGSAEWQSSKRGRIRFFGYASDNKFGVGGATETGNGTYRATAREHMAVLSWRDSSKALRPALAVGHSRFSRDESVSGYALATELASTQLVASLAYLVRDGLRLRGGGEFERLDTRYAGAADTSAARLDFDARPRSDRHALWADGTWESVHGLRLTIGMRSDDASLVRERQWDPRASLAYERGRLGLTASWGRHTQVAEPTFFRPATPDAAFTPMRLEQLILGAQWGGDTLGVRVELYEKWYNGLWQFDRTLQPVGGGSGRARGADAFFKWRPFPSTMTRLTWSTVSSQRTAPDVGTMARALGDLAHSITWVTESRWRTWTIGTARRWATGRPFTDIMGSVDGSDGPEPIWGAPNAARLPDYGRFDLSLSHYRALSAENGLVLFASVSNVFAENNVMRYRWTPDLSERISVRAPFNRSVYVGATLLF
jgi:hypothetical protein